MILLSGKKLKKDADEKKESKNDVVDYEELSDEVVEEEEEEEEDKSNTMGSRQKAREHVQELQRLAEKVMIYCTLYQVLEFPCFALQISRCSV